jgi:hypothetical protein
VRSRAVRMEIAPRSGLRSVPLEESAIRAVSNNSQALDAYAWLAGSIAAKIDFTPETLLGWVRQAERDQWMRVGPTSEAREDQDAGAREPRTPPSQSDPAQGVGVFCDGGARPPVQASEKARSSNFG